MKNRDMVSVYEALCKKYNLEELVSLKLLLDKGVIDQVNALNVALGINNVVADVQASTTTVVQVPVTPVTPAPIVQTPVVKAPVTPVVPVTTEQAAEIFIEEVKKPDAVDPDSQMAKDVLNVFQGNTSFELYDDEVEDDNDYDVIDEVDFMDDEEEVVVDKVVVDTTPAKDTTKAVKNWPTKGMTCINKFDPKTRLYKEFTTDKEGVLHCVTSNLDPSVLGGQLGHNGKIYNFIFSTKFELPVVLGNVSVEYLKEIKEDILKCAPKTFVEADKLDTKYMTDYGYGGRFYYDELEEGSFIFKTKDGYKGFTQGMSFRIAIDEDTDEERIYTLKNGFFFSQNYENAQSKRQMRLYPNLVEDIKVLVSKVDERFMNYREYEQATKDNSTKVEDSSTAVKEVKDVPETKGRSRFSGLFDM